MERGGGRRNRAQRPTQFAVNRQCCGEACQKPGAAMPRLGSSTLVLTAADIHWRIALEGRRKNDPSLRQGLGPPLRRPPAALGAGSLVSGYPICPGMNRSSIARFICEKKRPQRPLRRWGRFLPPGQLGVIERHRRNATHCHLFPNSSWLHLNQAERTTASTRHPPPNCAAA